MIRLSTLLLLGLMACSSGGHWQHFRWTALEEARKRNMPIFLHFHDEKDELSRKQKEILEKIIKDPLFRKVGAYRIQRGVERDLENFAQISSSAVLVVYLGSQEKGRNSGGLDPDVLKSLMKSALR